MVISFESLLNPSRIRYWGFAHGARRERRARQRGTYKKAVQIRELTLVQTLRRPVLETRAQREAARSQDFLDFVERLATQVRGLEQLGLGTLDQVADVVDVLGLQAVRRTDRQFELVDRTQQDRIELGGARGRLVERGDVAAFELREHGELFDQDL